MKITGLSASPGRYLPPESRPLPAPFEKQPGPPKPKFGFYHEGEEELDRLWDTGEIDHYGKQGMTRSEAQRTTLQRRPGSASEEEDRTKEPLSINTSRQPSEARPFKEVMGREISQFESFNKVAQPTTKGPTVLYSNVLELRRKFLESAGGL